VLAGLLVVGALIAIALVRSTPAPSADVQFVEGEVIVFEEAA
jgi:hypothetical protein